MADRLVLSWRDWNRKKICVATVRNIRDPSADELLCSFIVMHARSYTGDKIVQNLIHTHK